MSAVLIDNGEKGRLAYDSLVISDPTKLSAFNNKLSLKIIKVLAENPSCAIDIARKLKVHEQKVYYHLKHLERTGIIYTISSERRHGMIAKIYSVVSPVIAAKLFEGGTEIKEQYSTIPSQVLVSFFSPFIENGRLNSKIIIGDSYPHGKYDTGATEGAHISDLLLFMGKFLQEFKFPNYKIDTETIKEELKENLILIGNNRTNTIIDTINSELPIYFDPEQMSVVSSKTNNVYRDDGIGVVLKTKNPLNPKNTILLLGSLRGRGIRTATICILKYIENKFKNLNSTDEIYIIAQGLDKDGDRIIDEVKILEG
jgi:DNA-binding transcriptional ArsR family regulator